LAKIWTKVSLAPTDDFCWVPTVQRTKKSPVQFLASLSLSQIHDEISKNAELKETAWTTGCDWLNGSNSTEITLFFVRYNTIVLNIRFIQIRYQVCKLAVKASVIKTSKCSMLSCSYGSVLHRKLYLLNGSPSKLPHSPLNVMSSRPIADWSNLMYHVLCSSHNKSRGPDCNE